MDVSYFANGFVQYANWSSTRLRNKLPIASEFASERSRTTRNLIDCSFRKWVQQFIQNLFECDDSNPGTFIKKKLNFYKKFELLYV